MAKKTERLRNIAFWTFIAVMGLLILGALYVAGYSMAEAVNARETCEAQGLIAVQKAISGYVCIEAAP